MEWDGGEVKWAGGGGTGDRPSYIFTHPCWDLESELGGWCCIGCSKHNPKPKIIRRPFDNCSQVMSSKTMENYRIAFKESSMHLLLHQNAKYSLILESNAFIFIRNP